jgi:chromosome segregation ATPase
VDAALDEPNQAAVARLLTQLTRQDGCQVLCVSHNAPFQALVDGLVRVARRGGSTVVAGVVAGGVGGGDAAGSCDENGE